MQSDPNISDAYTAYLLGNFQGALKYIQKLRTSDPTVLHQADILTYRVYIAQKKFGIVLDEIPEGTDVVELKLLRLLARLLSSESDRDSIITETEKILSGTLNADDSTALVLGATILMNAGLLDKALKYLHNSVDVHCDVLTMQCLLALNHPELAGKVVASLQKYDEDALPVQLATAFYYLVKGGEQFHEALHTYEDLKDKYGATSMLVNGQTAALIGMNQWTGAEAMAQEAMDLDSTNPDTLVNAIVVAQHLGKPEEHINRLMSQLRDSSKDDPFLADLATKEEEFARFSQLYAPSVSG